MKGMVTRLHEERTGTDALRYLRVQFELEDGSWAKTDLVPRFRNYAKWKKLRLEVGMWLDGLVMKSANTVDADGIPTPCAAPERRIAREDEPATLPLFTDLKPRSGHPRPSEGPSTQFTHKLEHNKQTNRWRCACGYTLGDGREAFLAPCPLSMASGKVADTTPKGKPQNDRKTRGRRRDSATDTGLRRVRRLQNKK